MHRLSLGLLVTTLFGAFTTPSPVCAQQPEQAGVSYHSESPLLNAGPGPIAPTPDSSVSYANRGTVPVPGPEVLDLKRPRGDYPALLSPQDYFGRAQRPSTVFADPYNSSLAADGNPTFPGEKPILKERAMYIQTQPWAMPLISVSEDGWVTLILMREGEIVYPRSQLVGASAILEVLRSSVKESPYLYLRSQRLKTDRSGNYLKTTLDVEVVDKQQQVFVYKFDVQVVPMEHPSLVRTIKVDMTDTQLPPIYGREGSRYADATDGKSSAASSTQNFGGGTAASLTRSKSDEAGFQPGSGAYADGRRFSREDTRRLLPLMIGMAKAYDEATQAGAKGYEATNIVPFQPCTVMPGRDGRPERIPGKIPGFKNPYDGQVYFVLRSYFFPRYDAILYDVSVRNSSSETLWWDYSQLGLIPGYESSDHVETPTVVSPEMGETTPPNATNTLWVLLQGRGWLPSTAVRLAFPTRSMESKVPTVVLPHIATPPTSTSKGGVSITRPEDLDLWAH